MFSVVDQGAGAFGSLQTAAQNYLQRSRHWNEDHLLSPFEVFSPPLCEVRRLHG